MSDLVLVDLGLGNLRSVEKALEHAAGAAPLVTADPARIGAARRLVVPGQGAYRDGVAALERDGGALRAALGEALARGVPYLGICLGLQLLLEGSDEAPGAPGLGVVKGHVRRLPDDLVAIESGAEKRLKVPHMGWNEVVRVATDDAALPARDWFYFVHSYHAVPDDPADVAATAEYGGLALTAALRRGPLLATQFHPEKSQRAGLALLTRFLA
jgi:glutamine amidotransferase